MTTHLSYQHAINTIRLMYEQQGFKIPTATLGEQVRNEIGIDIKEAPYAALYAFIDEYIALMRKQSIYFLSACHTKNAIATVFYRLSIRQLRTLTSIRTLCSYGLDSNARLLLRLLYETTLLWVRFRIDNDCLLEYSECNTPEAANQFWHKYLSKEKTERYIEKQISEQGLCWLGGDKNIIGDMKKKLSLVAHPTFLSDYYETLSDWREAPSECGVTKPSEMSYFTLVNSITVTAIPFSIFPAPPYNIEAKSLRNNTTDWNPIHETESWDDYNSQIRNMFPVLFLMAIRFFEGFDTQKSDQSSMTSNE